MKIKNLFLTLLFACATMAPAPPYPIDGYDTTGIRRLKRLQLIESGELEGAKLIPGALKTLAEIELNLTGERGDSLQELPDPDPVLQKKLNALFPNLHESYSVSLLDITPDRPVRYAKRQDTRGFQPGSVGKLAVVAGFFCELETIFPDSFALRQDLLREKMVRAGPWAMVDQHTIPLFDPETNQFSRRTVQEKDVFSLYEWTDYMLSVSNNGAASVIWRETMLMHYFGPDYPSLTEEQAEAFFRDTPKATLTELALNVVNQPLRDLGISEEEWRLGSFLTRGAKAIVPGAGGSIGSPRGLMKFMVALERGAFIDPETSLEIKRLLYMTDRRIRYAASPALTEAAVYFKSGSLYKCKEEEGYSCGKYRGNVYNYMNSVAIVEHPDSTTYLVALMSNVLKKNSNIDHNGLASRIDRIVRQE